MQGHTTGYVECLTKDRSHPSLLHFLQLHILASSLVPSLSDQLECHQEDSQTKKKILETKSRMVVLGLEGGRNGELLFNEHGASVSQDKKSCGDKQWSWLHKVMNVFNITKLNTEKWLIIIFMLCINLPQ